MRGKGRVRGTAGGLTQEGVQIGSVYTKIHNTYLCTPMRCVVDAPEPPATRRCHYIGLEAL